MRIYVSPSTQDWNEYAGVDTNEEVQMRAICFPVAAALTAAGHVVKVGGVVSARANADDGNAWGADLYVAVHSNAGGGHGTEAWYYTGSVRGQRLAQAIYNRVAAVSDAPDRGVKSSTGYIELRRPKAPACIIEVAFHDCAEEAAEIMRDGAQFADAIAKGILEVAGGVSVPPTNPPPKPKPPLLRQGSRGTWVKTLQIALNRHGANLKVDGIFGPRTRAAVKAFQRAERIGVDGIVGPVTWGRLGY